MEFEQSLQPGILLRRYKRFLADVRLENGEVLTVHCPNSGSLRGCLAPESPIMLSRSPNPARKFPHTLEMIRVGREWVGVNTSLANRLVSEACERGVVEELGRPDEIVWEIKVSERSRLDLLLIHEGHRTYVEVKNCTLAEAGCAMFPDAVTARGSKHLQELLLLARAGHRAAVLFCVQRADVHLFRPAAHIDPVYAAALRQAQAQGVLALAYQAEVRPTGVDLVRKLPVDLS